MFLCSFFLSLYRFILVVWCFYFYSSVCLLFSCSCVRKSNMLVVILFVLLLGSGQGREGQVRRLRAVTCLLIQSNNNNQVRTGQRRVWMTWPQYCCLRLFLYTCLKHEGTNKTKQEQTREYIVYFKKVVGSGLIQNFRSKNTLKTSNDSFIHSFISSPECLRCY